MQIQSLCALPATLLRYRPREGQCAIAVICKATYRLAPVTSVLAPDQDPLQIGEKHFHDDPTQSVECPNDLVPFKSRAEVMLVGSAFAPLRRLTRAVGVRMIVGSLNKALDVYSSRTLHADGSVREGPSWASMPLRYELAAGGPETWNPVGLKTNWDSVLGIRVLPQIVSKGDFVAEASQSIAPDGFGPISARWRIRSESAWTRTQAFVDNNFEARAMGSDFDTSIFQAAPKEQQLDVLRADERIVLENLHPDHARLVTNLQGLAPVMFVDAPGNTPTPQLLRPDTLWINTDRGICTMTFRGHLVVSSFDQPGTVVLALQEPGKTMSWSDVESKLPRVEKRVEIESKRGASQDVGTSSQHGRGGYDPDMTTDIDVTSFHGSQRVIPFGAQSRPSPSAIDRLPNFSDDDDNAGTAVFHVAPLHARASESGRVQAAPEPKRQESTQVINTSHLLGGTPAIPFAKTSPAPNLSNPLPMAPTEPKRVPIAPPPLPGVVSPRSSSGTPTFAVLSSPPSVAVQPAPVGNFSAPAPPAAPPLGVLSRAPAPVFSGAAAPPAFAPNPQNAPTTTFGEAPLPPRSLDVSPPKTIGEMQVKSKSAGGYDGVLAASNAAADAQSYDKPSVDKRIQEKPIADPSVPDEGASIEVIWYENAYVARIRKHPQWASLVQAPPKAAPVQRGQAPVPPPSAEALEEVTNADLYAVLSQGEPAREHDVVPGRKGTKDRETALYLLAGTISFPLDDIELLKATSRAAAPLAASDKKLKEVLDLVEEVLKMPLEGAPEVVQGFIVRVRESWSHANRILPADYLTTHTERTLLNQRSYQKRELLDDEWIRALYLSSPDAVPIPTYIPAKLAKRLPLFRQVSARIVVEALSQQDMYESHSIALRVVALARVLAPQESTTPARGRR